MELNKEIHDLIKQNLPEATAGVLRDRIIELEEKEKELVDKKSVIKYITDEGHKKDKQILELTAQLAEHKSLSARTQKLKEELEEVKDANRQLSYDRKVVELRESFADTRVADHKSVLNLLFRNKTISKTTMDHVVTKAADVTQMDYGNNGECKTVVIDQGENVIPVTKTEEIREN